MGEIKSTLDLVMERTKNLNFGKEEKKEQMYKEIKGKINGLLLKFKDGVLNKEGLERELAMIQEKSGVEVENIFKQVILEKILPGETDSSLFDLLEGICRANTMEIKSIMNDYQDAVNVLRQKRAREVVEMLDSEHNISGSAVEPNLESDRLLEVEVKSIQSKFDPKLNQAKKKLVELGLKV